MARETGKQRSQRIQLDYYRKGGGLALFRKACILVALASAGLYAVYVLAAGGGGHTSTGALSRAHAAFEADCNSCHENFTPIDSQAVNIDFGPISSAASIAHLQSTCQRCHEVGDHYQETMNEEGIAEDKNCGVCHVEHLGRDNDLNLVANRHCVSCHGNLSRVCAGPSINANVTAFSKADHGEFQSIENATDAGSVKFDHAQHMQAGQVAAGERGGFTYAMLAEADRGRYQPDGVDDSELVQLDCSSCHEMAGNPAEENSLSFDNELGRYIKPIAFEQHCAACHAMNPKAALADSSSLPHAVPWNRVRFLLEANREAALLSGQARADRDDTQAIAQPGEGRGDPPASASLLTDAEKDAKWAADKKLIESKCLQCHEAEHITNEWISNLATNPPLIPPRWFVHGLYDHAVHREIDCKYCHDQAYEGDGSGEANDHNVVMIRGIDTCTGCHRDPDTPTPGELLTADAQEALGDAFKHRTWAPDTCITCHRYHTLNRQVQSSTAATEAPQ